MVLPQIGKDSNLKRNSGCPVKHKPLWGNLHHNTVAPCLDHFRKILMNRVGFRRCVVSRYWLIANNCLDSTNQTYLVSHALQNGFYHIGGGGLSLCSGNSDNLKLICRIAEVRRRHQSQGVTGILHTDHRHILQSLHLFFCNQCFRAFCPNLSCILVTVGYRAADADKYTSWRHLSGIVNKLCDFNLMISLYDFIF